MLDAVLYVFAVVESCLLWFLWLIYVAPTLDMLYLALYKTPCTCFVGEQMKTRAIGRHFCERRR